VRHDVAPDRVAAVRGDRAGGPTGDPAGAGQAPRAVGLRPDTGVRERLRQAAENRARGGTHQGDGRRHLRAREESARGRRVDRGGLGRRPNPRWAAPCGPVGVRRCRESEAGDRRRPLAHGRLEPQRLPRRLPPRVPGQSRGLHQRPDADVHLRHGPGRRGHLRPHVPAPPRAISDLSQWRTAELHRLVLEPQQGQAGQPQRRGAHQPHAQEPGQASGRPGPQPHPRPDER